MTYAAPDSGIWVQGEIDGDEVEFEIDDIFDLQPLETDGIFAVTDERGKIYLVQFSSDEEWIPVDPETLDSEQTDIYESEILTQKTTAKI